MTNRELLDDIREMADPNGTQIYHNDLCRLRAIEDHISGNIDERRRGYLFEGPCGHCDSRDEPGT